MSDVDVIWFRNPMPFIGRFPEADLLISSDFTYPSVGAEEELEKYEEVLHLYFNVGEWEGLSEWVFRVPNSVCW